MLSMRSWGPHNVHNELKNWVVQNLQFLAVIGNMEELQHNLVDS